MRRVTKACLGVTTLALALASAASCKGPLAKIEAVRDALEKDDDGAIKSATGDYAACSEADAVAVAPGQPGPRDKGCLLEIANALGSKKGYNTSPPDQSSAAAAAVVLVRDGRGDYLPPVEAWHGAIKNGKGPGADALRLAIAKKMAEASPKVGRKIDDDAAAAETAKAIATAIPGACPTYYLVGTSKDATKIPPELTPEHASCVQRDLARREGPGASYGSGMFRALEGALAVWRETERALRVGLPNASETTKAVVEAKLKTIEAATQAIATKKIAAVNPAAVVQFMGDVHADAGIILWKDAGADGSVEGGAAPVPTPPPLKRMPGQ